MKKTIEKRDEIKLVGLKVRTNNLGEMNPLTMKIGPTVMRYFGEQWGDKIPHRKNPGTTLCSYSEYESDHTGDYSYLIGEEVTSFDNIPEGLSKFTIPAQNYAKFTTNPGIMPLVCIDAWQKIWAMSESELARAYLADFELYDKRAENPQNTVLDICIGLK